MSFSTEFSTEFAAGDVIGQASLGLGSGLVAAGFTTAPPPPPPPPPPRNPFELLDCPEVEILTGAAAEATLGLPGNSGVLSDYGVLAAQPSYSSVLADWTFYSSLMEGHAGFAGGPSAPGTGGYGLRLGVVDTDLGVEYWVTDLEGWESGPEVDLLEVEALTGGTWIDRVRAKSREFVIKGAVVARSQDALERAKRGLTAALATPPHFGVLRVGGSVNGLRVPVALAAPVKVKQIGTLAIEFELTVKGRDAGTAGSGVWREGRTREYQMGANATVDVVTDSFVSSRPMVRWVGPLIAGQSLSDGERALVLGQNLANNQVLVVDCATWQVALDGMPARYMLTPQSSALAIDPQTESLYSSGPAATGTISVTVTDIY